MTIAASFCFFLVLMILVGIASSWKQSNSADDYLTAGRSHGKFVIALSAAASATSGFVMIGAVGAGYSLGVMAVLMPLSWFFGDLIFWTFFPEKINRIGRESDCTTIPELISYRATGKKTSSVRKFLALATVIFIGLYAIGQFLAAGKAINGVFDIPTWLAVVISSLIILAYSAKGGLKSSIPTQFVQAIIMLFTTVGMFLVALYLIGGPAELVVKVAEVNSNLLKLDGGRGVLLTLAFIGGFATTAFTFDIGQPHLLVRILASKSPEEAAKARWIYLVFMQLTWVSMSLFGLAMVVLLPDLKDAERALPVFARTSLNPILAGAVLAGIFASVASTLDGLILVLSSSFGVDIMPAFYKKMSDKYGAKYQIGITLAVTIVTTIATVLLIGTTSVFDIIVFSSAALGVTIGCTMFISILKWRTSEAALIVGAVTGLVVAMVWRYFGLNSVILEAMPGFAMGIIAHQLYMAVLVKR